VHGGGDHPVPGQDGHGDPGQLRRGGRPERLRVYVWIRRFESEAARTRLYDAVYQSDYWKNEISARVGTMIDREQIKVTRLVATPRSPIQ
jgi:hypothetical protein